MGKEVATTMREPTSVGRHSTRGVWLWALALLVLAGAGAVLALRWDEVPERFPIHWNAHGEPDRWTDRSLGSVVGPLLVGIGSCAFLVFLTWGLPRLEWGQKRSPARRAIEAQLLHEILGATALGMAVLFAITTLQPLRSRPEELPSGLGWGVALGVVALLAFIFWRAAAAGRHLEAVEPLPAAERRHWRWGGMFYVNPADPQILVPKRLGIGWTFNMARPASWVALAALLLPGLVAVVLVLLLAR